jgi:hypothetical protein
MWLLGCPQSPENEGGTRRETPFAPWRAGRVVVYMVHCLHGGSGVVRYSGGGALQCNTISGTVLEIRLRAPALTPP